MTNQKQSEQITDLMVALIKAESDFGTIEKDCEVKAGSMKFKYASLTEIYNKTKPALQRHNLKIIGTLDTSSEGHLILSMTLYHVSGQYISSSIRLTPQSAKPSDMGSVLTYMRRYLYSTLLGIAADEDVDGDALNEAAKKQAPKNLIDREIFELAEALCCNSTDFEIETLSAYLLRSEIKSRIFGPLEEAIVKFKANTDLKKAVNEWIQKKTKTTEQPKD